MALLVNSLGDTIKNKDFEKFYSFLDRACASVTNGVNNIVILNSLKDLLTKASSTVSGKIQKAVNDRALAEMNEASECLVVGDGGNVTNSIDLTETTTSSSSSSSNSVSIDNAQFIEPRGRFNVSVTASGLLLQGKQSLFVPWTKVTHAARVPSHMSTKKDGEDMLMFKLVTEQCVELNNKPVKHLLWVLSNARTPSSSENDISVAAESESDRVSSLVQAHLKSFGKRIGTVNPSLFQSVIHHKPYIRCYCGLQEGGVYPLRNGVLFLKPVVYVPIEEIASVACGRGGGTGNTRYVDLKLETIDDKTIEFTNIEREELPSLQNYVKNHLEVKARQRAAASAAAEVEEHHHSSSAVNSFMNTQFGDGDDDDDDDEDDEDFDPDAAESEDEGAGGHRGNGGGYGGGRGGGHSDEDDDNSDDSDGDNSGDDDDDDSDASGGSDFYNNAAKKSKSKSNSKTTKKVMDVDGEYGEDSDNPVKKKKKASQKQPAATTKPKKERPEKVEKKTVTKKRKDNPAVESTSHADGAQQPPKVAKKAPQSALLAIMKQEREEREAAAGTSKVAATLDLTGDSSPIVIE